MKIIDVAVLTFFAGCSVLATGCMTQPSAKTNQLEAKIMTFNIRYYRAPNDGLDAWEYRREMVADIIKDSGADVIGSQEGELPQIEYLRGKLEDDFGILATYTDGETKRSANALFYRKSRFKVGDWGTFWLSDTPEEPNSNGWGNRISRLCTWARFVEKETGKSFYFYNAHLDHQAHLMNQKGVRLIANRINQRNPTAPFVLVGDLNSQEDNPVIHFRPLRVQ